MIINHTNQDTLSFYRCPICGEMYKKQTGEVRLSCAVRHSPGSCCHFGEIKIDSPQAIGLEVEISKIIDVIELRLGGMSSKDKDVIEAALVWFASNR